MLGGMNLGGLAVVAPLLGIEDIEKLVYQLLAIANYQTSKLAN